MHYHARYVSAGNEDGGAKKDILFISRAVGRRTISNELELLIALQRVPRLKRVVLEELSLSDQVAKRFTFPRGEKASIHSAPFDPCRRCCFWRLPPRCLLSMAKLWHGHLSYRRQYDPLL